MQKDLLKYSSQKGNNLFFLLGIIFLIVIRFLWINEFPPGINHDEADVVLSAKTYWLEGVDVSGVKFPLSLIATKTEAGLSGLPSIILAPFVGPHPLTQANVRIPFLFVNLMSIAFLCGVVWQSTKDQKLTLITAFVSLINPWLFTYSRSATEAPFALAFFLAGAFFLFKSKKTSLVISMIMFSLSFYSYFGAKPVLLVLVPGLLIMKSLLSKKSTIKTSFGVIGVFLFFVSLYILVTAIYAGGTLKSRSSEISIFNLEKYSEAVDEKRRASIETPLSRLQFNKLNEFLWETAEKYIGFLSPTFLFFEGDPTDRATYTFGEHGVFYILDGVFIIFGIASLILAAKQKKWTLLVTTLVLLFVFGPFSSALNSVKNSYFFRAFLLIPAFLILISLGIYFTLALFEKNKMISRILTTVIILVYFLSYFNFLNYYFFRFSVKNQENNFLGERVLSNYLKRLSENKTVVVIGRSPLQLYQQYLLVNFEKGFGTEDKTYKLNNILFIDKCPEELTKETAVVQQGLDCEVFSGVPFLQIQQQKDAGTLFKIYNDTLCGDYGLSPWRRYHKISDYSIERMSSREFCERWISK